MAAWTYNLSGASLTISGSWGLTAISIYASSGTVNVKGTLIAGSLASQNIAITTTTGPITVGSPSGLAVGGLIIDATSGAAIIIGTN